MAHKNDTLPLLDELITHVLARLSLNPDYIEFRALEKARAEIAASSHRKTVAMVDDTTGEKLLLVPTGDFSHKRPNQLEASAMALTQAGEPQTTPQMVQRVRALGAKVGGQDPKVNLGSTLSRSAEFCSLRWKGEPAWWFANKALPSPLLRLKEAAE